MPESWQHKGISRNNTIKKGVLPQVLDQLLDTIQVAAKQALFFFLRAGVTLASRPRSPILTSDTAICRKCFRELARAALQQSRHGVAGSRAGDRGRLGHEVKVEELDEFELDVAAGASGAEERGDGEQAVEALKRSRVLRRVNERSYECEESG